MSFEHPKVLYSPENPLLDETINIVFSGLKKDKNYRIVAQQKDDDGVLWHSETLFTSDQNGKIDLSLSAPIAGNYDRVDPMGIFWSMQPQLQGNAPKRNFVNKYLSPISCSLSAYSDSELITSRIIDRQRISCDIERIPLSEDGLVGSYFCPTNANDCGATIYLTGSGGGESQYHAAMLASRGIPALSLAYFNAQGLPKELRKIPLEYFEKAIHWMNNQKELDGNRIAIIGQSRGAELALLLGSRFQSIKGVICYAPNCFVYGSFGKENEKVCAAWTFQGRDIEYFSTHTGEKFGQELSNQWDNGGYEQYVKFLLNEPELAATVIPADKVNGPILLFSGHDDSIWPSSFLANVTTNILRLRDYPFQSEHITYENVGHFFPVGYLPTTVMQVTHPVSGQTVPLGGQAKEVSHAGHEAWLKTLNFLKCHLI